MQRRFRGPPTAAIVIAVAVFEVVGTVFASARQPDHRPLDVLAFVLLLAGPASLSLRRRAPLVMLPAAAASVTAYLALGYPWGPVFLSLALAIVFAAAAGRRWQTWAVAAACAALLVAGAAGSGDEFALVRAFAGTSWLAILVLLGEGVRLRSERVAERRRQQEAREQAARDEYRLALARDIHDVVAHSLSLINVRASVALHLGEKDPGQFRPALEAIKAASRDSLAEVRQLLGVLRDDAPLSPAPPPRLDRIPALVDDARRAGLEVTLTQPDSAVVHQLPDAVQEASYRIVQEALTNVVRHSGAQKAVVVLALAAGGTPGEPQTLTVTVDDDGSGAAGAPEGNGVKGMRERAAAVGGTLHLTPLNLSPQQHGWRVRAVMPVAGPMPGPGQEAR
ncbi:sensor histidine kinase [Arthrobacter sp. ISL-28]|uniref:sensor histidine kinase n=1 Tax=Arthrobacter sp. ISL-28 TaxID=2819108 RepID=UPI001BE7FAD2|nr:sensor histidine kinase [Arthrobacter sp. ISL-28]MBT2520378.1 sensor histidine kinase [Arthrobacter sp. ISL-28]